MEILEFLVSLGPLGIIALLGYVIYLLVKQGREQVRQGKGQDAIATNHLHDLPEVVETLRRMEAQMRTMNDHLVWIRARINGHSH